jgi:hypothetical protein
LSFGYAGIFFLRFYGKAILERFFHFLWAELPENDDAAADPEAKKPVA